MNNDIMEANGFFWISNMQILLCLKLIFDYTLDLHQKTRLYLQHIAYEKFNLFTNSYFLHVGEGTKPGD